MDKKLHYLHQCLNICYLSYLSKIERDGNTHDFSVFVYYPDMRRFWSLIPIRDAEDDGGEMRDGSTKPHEAVSRRKNWFNTT